MDSKLKVMNCKLDAFVLGTVRPIAESLLVAGALFCLGLMSVHAQTVDLENGLIAYYPFNGNANDESGNGNDGTVNGATLAADRNGKTGKAYSFDGDDYIEVSDNDKLNAGENFALSVWYTVEGPSDNDYGTIIGKDGRNSGWWLSTERSGNTTTKIRWEHYSVGGENGRQGEGAGGEREPGERDVWDSVHAELPGGEVEVEGPEGA